MVAVHWEPVQILAVRRDNRARWPVADAVAHLEREGHPVREVWVLLLGDREITLRLRACAREWPKPG